MRRWFQFRLRTLLVAVTVAALAVWATVTFVRPLIEAVTFDGWTVTMHLSPAGGDMLIPDLDLVPPGSSPSSPSSGANLLHDAYISVSLVTLTALLAILLPCSTAAYLGIWRLVAYLGRACQRKL